MHRIFIFVVSLVCFCLPNDFSYANGYMKAVKNNRIAKAQKLNKQNVQKSDNNKKQRTKIVGVIGDRLPNENNKHDYTHWPIYAMRYQYIDNFAKVCKDNNIAFVMLPDDLSQTDKFINAVDAIVLTGGGDDPTGVRDKFEKEILLGVMKQKKQVFGICRGLQMINLFLGGEIVSLKDTIKTNENHKQASYCLTCDKTVHDVNLNRKSMIGRILKTDKIDVNSNHNFIVGKLADGVIITGKSPDGVPEVLEIPSYEKYLLAVQWHPEFLATKYDEKLIKSFCDAVERNK